MDIALFMDITLFVSLHITHHHSVSSLLRHERAMAMEEVPGEKCESWPKV